MERRRFPRHPVDRPAKIMIPGGDSIPVRIANESEGGEKLNVRWAGWLPKAFYLQEAFSGATRAVKTIWRHVSSIGVQFIRSKSDESRGGFGRRHR
jgi:hypothetical protein